MEDVSFKEKEFNIILDKIKNRIKEKSFETALLKMQEIDEKHSKKIISSRELLCIIEKIQTREVMDLNGDKYLALLDGNINDVFALILESLRYNISLEIIVDNFCLGQDTLLVTEINSILEIFHREKIFLKNDASNEEIIDKSKLVKKVLFISTSEKYEDLKDSIENSVFYPYNYIEIFYEDNKFKDLVNKIYVYTAYNHYQIDIYDDTNIFDTVDLMNTTGYGYCSIIFSNDEEKIEYFKEKVQSQKIYVNENPFLNSYFELNYKMLV